MTEIYLGRDEIYGENISEVVGYLNQLEETSMGRDKMFEEYFQWELA